MDPTTDIIDEYTIPKFDRQTIWERPECEVPGLMSVVQEFKDLFRTSPGVTFEAHHYIPTSGSPVRILPRQIRAHYHENIEEQIQHMLSEGIMKESSSPWMVPVVFVKKSGEIRH